MGVSTRRFSVGVIGSTFLLSLRFKRSLEPSGCSLLLTSNAQLKLDPAEKAARLSASITVISGGYSEDWMVG